MQVFVNYLKNKTMKKQQYIAPQLLIVTIHSAKMIASSPVGTLNDSDTYRINSSEEFGSRRRGSDFYDDEDDDW